MSWTWISNAASGSQLWAAIFRNLVTVHHDIVGGRGVGLGHPGSVGTLLEQAIVPVGEGELLRTFAVPDTTATHVRFVVVANQCTGNRNFQGDQHDDPASPTSDCRSTEVGSEEVRAAELQLLTSRPLVEGATLVE